MIERGDTAIPDETALVAEATATLGHAYAPYSRFPVAAALRTRSGRVYRGVNVENASLGLSMCAERSAILAAVAAGERSFDAIAIVSKAPEPTPPCGACRQVLLEFCADDMMVLLATAQMAGRVDRHTLGALTPLAFRHFEPGA
jgi:cytidine deaminase